MSDRCNEAVLIEINTYGEGHYSGSVYNEVMFITTEDFLKYFGNGAEKLTPGVIQAVAESGEVYLGELDGKYSEVYGDIECVTWTIEEIKNHYEEPLNDGTKLRDYLIYNYAGQYTYEEQKNILKEIEDNVAKVLESINPLVEVTVKVPKEKIEELEKFAESLCKN